MVKPRPVNPPGLGKPLGYAHGMKADGLLFVAGQIGANPRPDGRHAVVAGGFVAQFEKALQNVLAVVEEAGGRADAIVEMTIFVTDLAAYRRARSRLGPAWRRTMGRHYPAITLVGVAGLFEPKALVEIRAVAVVP